MTACQSVTCFLRLRCGTRKTYGAKEVSKCNAPAFSSTGHAYLWLVSDPKKMAVIQNSRTQPRNGCDSEFQMPSAGQGSLGPSIPQKTSAIVKNICHGSHELQSQERHVWESAENWQITATRELTKVCQFHKIKFRLKNQWHANQNCEPAVHWLSECQHSA